MVDDEVATDSGNGSLFPQSVGGRLHDARIAAGLDLGDIAGKTRVPIRHLEALERADYAALPSATYAIGFARSFARAIGADEVAITRDLRAELGRAPPEEADYTPYEPADPARVPSRLLAWTTAAIAVLLLVGYLVWRSELLGGGTAAVEPPPLVTTPTPAPVAATPTPATPSPTGQVVLTATSPIWLRIYDRADRVLLEKEMAAGETFTVPADADTPMIRTGRPEALKVTIDGMEVAPLGPPERTLRDLEISAKALVARPAVPPEAAAPAPTTPASTAPRRPQNRPRATTTGPVEVTPASPPVATPATNGNSVGE
jgi:hypothetical protein